MLRARILCGGGCGRTGGRRGYASGPGDLPRPSSAWVPGQKKITKEIVDDYALLKTDYKIPKYTVVLSHGLFGFSTLSVPPFAPLHYWHGITGELVKRGIKVLTTSVSPSATIQTRANQIARQLEQQVPNQPISIIAHSMGGLDARCLISTVRSAKLDIRALVTIATPHRGSSIADILVGRDGDRLVAAMGYPVLQRFGLSTGGFAQLTRAYMEGTFNPLTPNVDGVRYFSYGSKIVNPSVASPFWLSERVLRSRDGPNDGLVGVESAQWGEYGGTLVDVSHMDVINWTNRVERGLRRLTGKTEGFNAVAFYLSITDMLAREGL